jgi:hypothetical protein
VVSPFQSILQPSHEVPKPANDDEHRETAAKTIGDLLPELTAQSPDSSPMNTTTLSDNGLAFSPHSRPPLRGGIYSETYATDFLNWYILSAETSRKP